MTRTLVGQNFTLNFILFLTGDTEVGTTLPTPVSLLWAPNVTV